MLARTTRAREERIENKWKYLHAERLRVEGFISSDIKREHLQLPNIGRELDFNGDEFERVEVFHPRFGPPPSFVAEARERVRREWTDDESDALWRALARFSGPMVLVKTIRKHCGQGGKLHKYSVTEIVTAAAIMRQQLLEAYQPGSAPDWVGAIPNWLELSQLSNEYLEIPRSGSDVGQ